MAFATCVGGGTTSGGSMLAANHHTARMLAQARSFGPASQGQTGRRSPGMARSRRVPVSACVAATRSLATLRLRSYADGVQRLAGDARRWMLDVVALEHAAARLPQELRLGLFRRGLGDADDRVLRVGLDPAVGAGRGTEGRPAGRRRPDAVA